MNVLPNYPWRCTATDTCDSAREGAECRSDSEAGPDCAAYCSSFRPAPTAFECPACGIGNWAKRTDGKLYCLNGHEVR